jgi:hypothetical protein
MDKQLQIKFHLTDDFESKEHWVACILALVSGYCYVGEALEPDRDKPFDENFLEFIILFRLSPMNDEVTQGKAPSSAASLSIRKTTAPFFIRLPILTFQRPNL